MRAVLAAVWGPSLCVGILVFPFYTWFLFVSWKCDIFLLILWNFHTCLQCILIQNLCSPVDSPNIYRYGEASEMGVFHLCERLRCSLQEKKNVLRKELLSHTNDVQSQEFMVKNEQFMILPPSEERTHCPGTPDSRNIEVRNESCFIG